ncbi:hypothetical protein ACIHCV_31505 [Streptomyces sp. NPDC051956]
MLRVDHVLHERFEALARRLLCQDAGTQGLVPPSGDVGDHRVSQTV